MPDLGTIIRTIREAGINVPIMGGDFLRRPRPVQGRRAGLRQRDLLRYAQLPGTRRDPRHGATSWTSYKAKYNAEPDAVWVATGWDVVMILAQAMEKAGSTDGAAMAKAMEDTEFSLLTGKLNWSGIG